MQDKNQQPYFELTETILGCCFDIMNELGSGFLESVYKNALFIALKEKGFKVIAEKKFEVSFRGRLVGVYTNNLKSWFLARSRPKFEPAEAAKPTRFSDAGGLKVRA